MWAEEQIMDVSAKDYGNGFLFGAEHRRSGRGGHLGVLDGGALAPLNHLFRVEAIAT